MGARFLQRKARRLDRLVNEVQDFIGAMKQGHVGTWMDWVNERRNESARNEVLGQEAIATSTMLHSALVQVCQGKAIAIVNKAGSGQGLEAWRMMLQRYEAKTRQSRVMNMIQILSWDFKTG